MREAQLTFLWLMVVVTKAKRSFDKKVTTRAIVLLISRNCGYVSRAFSVRIDR